jgi:hypothetical protein
VDFVELTIRVGAGVIDLPKEGQVASRLAVKRELERLGAFEVMSSSYSRT